MTSYGQEVLEFCSIQGNAHPLKIKVISRRLALEEFLPETIFINVTSPVYKSCPIWELTVDNSGVGLTSRNRCYVPGIPISDHRTILPPEGLETGRVLAHLRPAESNRPEETLAAILEFTQKRFIINFDLCGAINHIRRERYTSPKRPFYTWLPFNVQRISARLRHAAYRRLKERNKEPLFPTYPKDYSVQILTELFLHCIRHTTESDIRGNIWPSGKKYAFILTHDVDSDWVYQNKNLNVFLALEEKYGIRGAWFFVANLYRHDLRELDRLMSEGHEIALHGDNHDHKIAFLSEKHIRARMSACRWFLDRHQVVGFRSPHYLRTARLYEILKGYVRYDTSMHDVHTPTSPAGLMGEGCSTVHPFKLSDSENALLELPVTIPEDLKLYDPKAGSDSIIRKQLEHIQDIKQRNGLATLVLHPEPHFSAQKPYLEALEEVLRFIQQDRDCWIARPKDIYAYWTKRKLVPMGPNVHQEQLA